MADRKTNQKMLHMKVNHDLKVSRVQPFKKNGHSPFFSNGTNGFFQPKLKIGEAADKHEQKAGSPSENVLSNRNVLSNTNTVSIQHNVSPTQPIDARCREEVQRKEDRSDSNTKEAPGIVGDALGLGGNSLDGNTRSVMESRFGYDFSAVKIHTDTVAVKSAKSINALAYTSGNNIVFNEGQYSPSTQQGQQLLAHELTHVVQQSGTAANTVQRLAIVPVGNIATGTCGQYQKTWIFQLNNPAPEDGYIVQQVDMYEDIVDCPLTARELARPTFTFYEAWWLQRGERRQHIHTSVGFTDRAQRDPAPGKSGSHAAVGTIKFFRKSVTGDLGRENVMTSDTTSTWKPGNQGGVVLSGWLPSTTERPSWWANSTEGPVTRRASSDWSCCGSAASQWSTSSATP